jgi:hypothetical protein
MQLLLAVRFQWFLFCSGYHLQFLIANLSANMRQKVKNGCLSGRRSLKTCVEFGGDSRLFCRNRRDAILYMRVLYILGFPTKTGIFAL